MPRKINTEAERLTNLVSLRLTAADHAAYLAKVELSGMKPSVFFRECVLNNKTQITAINKPAPEWGRAVYLMNKASNNINQLAHQANIAHLSGKVSEATYTAILSQIQTLTLYLKATVKNAG